MLHLLVVIHLRNNQAYTKLLKMPGSRSCHLYRCKILVLELVNLQSIALFILHFSQYIHLVSLCTIQSLLHRCCSLTRHESRKSSACFFILLIKTGISLQSLVALETDTFIDFPLFHQKLFSPCLTDSIKRDSGL